MRNYRLIFHLFQEKGSFSIITINNIKCPVGKIASYFAEQSINGNNPLKIFGNTYQELFKKRIIFWNLKKKIKGVHKNLSARMFINILKILANRENKHLQKHRLHCRCQQENVIPSQAVWEGDVKERGLSAVWRIWECGRTCIYTIQQALVYKQRMLWRALKQNRSSSCKRGPWRL